MYPVAKHSQHYINLHYKLALKYMVLALLYKDPA